MSELWPEPNLTAVLSLWLGGLLLSLARWAKWPKAEAGVAGLLAGWTGLALAAGQPALVWLPPAGLAGAWLLITASRNYGERLRRLFGSARIQAMLFVLAGPLLGCAWAAYAFNGPEDLDTSAYAQAQPHDSSEDIEPAAQSALTDRGRPVPLFTHSDVSAGLYQAEQRATGPRALALIRTAAPELVCNCHGWVFAGGRYWVRSQSVDAILDDNGYRKVEQPQVGDVIVYRAGDNIVTHTGLVRVASEGLTLIESKWGYLGRYLHAPAGQPYGDSWTFYRSSRDGHVLHFAESESHNGEITPVTAPP